MEVRGKRKITDWLIFTVFIAAVIAGPRFFEAYLNSGDHLDDELSGTPVFATIKKTDPDAYAKMREVMLAELNQGKSKAEVGASVRPLVANLAKKYLPISSDTALINFIQVTTLEIDQIGAKSADACFNFLFPSPGAPPVSILEYVTPEVQERDIAVLNAVIESGSSNPQHPPPQQEVVPDLRRVFQELAAQHGAADVAAMARLAQLDHPKVCTLTSDFYKNILQLPAAKAAALLRFLFSQGTPA